MNTSASTATIERAFLRPAPAEHAAPPQGQTGLTAIKKRAAQPHLVAMFAVRSLLGQLPMLFPVDNKLPSSPKARYRSQYRYPGPEALLDETHRAKLSDFEIVLHLIDFSPLEHVLAHAYYVPSNKGQVPFHPVSMFLCICLRRELNLSWRALARLLASDHGAGWRALFGFQEGNTPSASGLRYFFDTVGPAVFDDLCPRYVQMLRQCGLFPERSTYASDPADQGITVTQSLP